MSVRPPSQVCRLRCIKDHPTILLAQLEVLDPPEEGVRPDDQGHNRCKEALV